MAQQTINVGTAPNDGTGDTLKTSFTKTNANFTELYGLVSAGSVGKQTIWIPAGAMISRATNGAAPGTIETTTNKNMIRTLDFDPVIREYAQFEIAMPKSWNEGPLSCVVIWSHGATTTNFTVWWAVDAQAVSNDDTLDIVWTGLSAISDVGGTTNDLYISDEMTPNTVSGSPAENDVVRFQIWRWADHGSDTLAIDARLHGVKIFYTTNAGTDA